MADVVCLLPLTTGLNLPTEGLRQDILLQLDNLSRFWLFFSSVSRGPPPPSPPVFLPPQTNYNL
jgi:hypothetical protein